MDDPNKFEVFRDCSCCHCSKYTSEGEKIAVVEVGDEPDWESQTTYICLTCARRAVAALETEETIREFNY